MASWTVLEDVLRLVLERSWFGVSLPPVLMLVLLFNGTWPDECRAGTNSQVRPRLRRGDPAPHLRHYRTAAPCNAFGMGDGDRWALALDGPVTARRGGTVKSKADRVTRPKLDWRTPRGSRISPPRKPVISTPASTAFFTRRQARLKAEAATRQAAAQKHTAGH
jgi:hypothetical protein